MVTEQPQYSVAVCIFSTWQNTEISLISNGLRLIYTCLLLLALAITFHTSRHTFATLLVMDGVSIYKIQKFLGHKSVNMTERYLKYDLKMAQVNMEEIDTFS
ncbi:tyrosine-type recombinase/integrase [Bacteroides acidifaciens]|uniref:tyrosine-type recombinase/integrase n=1 Tax=Bacteroides acidifaciens TaxID=85831 RepID=UPI0025AA188A|nr:tyrosine-type recombinase/integrase [Bacteroides acidifaciens]